MPQLTSAEQNLVDSITRAQRKSGADAWRAVNKLRENKGIGSVSVTAVHNYVNGITHTRGRPERRGRGQSKLAPSHVKKLMAVRRRMIKKANNEKRVTYADVIAEAGLDVDCAQRTMEDALRREGLSYHPARAKVQVSEDDAKARLAFAEEWSKKPPSFWTNSIHGFLDCKAWPVPLTPSQRTRYAQTRVTGHLRFPHEGTDRGFTKPRQKHDWIGTPSVSVAAVVSDDRLIVFEHVKGRWNGEAARAMYTNLVGPALKKRFPNARTSARAWAFACLCVCGCVCVCVCTSLFEHRMASLHSSSWLARLISIARSSRAQAWAPVSVHRRVDDRAMCATMPLRGLCACMCVVAARGSSGLSKTATARGSSRARAMPRRRT